MSNITWDNISVRLFRQDEGVWVEMMHEPTDAELRAWEWQPPNPPAGLDWLQNGAFDEWEQNQ